MQRGSNKNKGSGAQQVVNVHLGDVVENAVEGLLEEKLDREEKQKKKKKKKRERSPLPTKTKKRKDRSPSPNAVEKNKKKKKKSIKKKSPDLAKGLQEAVARYDELLDSFGGSPIPPELANVPDELLQSNTPSGLRSLTEWLNGASDILETMLPPTGGGGAVGGVPDSSVPIQRPPTRPGMLPPLSQPLNPQQSQVQMRTNQLEPLGPLGPTTTGTSTQTDPEIKQENEPEIKQEIDPEIKQEIDQNLETLDSLVSEWMPSEIQIPEEMAQFEGLRDLNERIRDSIRMYILMAEGREDDVILEEVRQGTIQELKTLQQFLNDFLLAFPPGEGFEESSKTFALAWQDGSKLLPSITPAYEDLIRGQVTDTSAPADEPQLREFYQKATALATQPSLAPEVTPLQVKISPGGGNIELDTDEGYVIVGTPVDAQGATARLAAAQAEADQSALRPTTLDFSSDAMAERMAREYLQNKERVEKRKKLFTRQQSITTLPGASAEGTPPTQQSQRPALPSPSSLDSLSPPRKFGPQDVNSPVPKLKENVQRWTRWIDDNDQNMDVNQRKEAEERVNEFAVELTRAQSIERNLEGMQRARELIRESQLPGVNDGEAKLEEAIQLLDLVLMNAPSGWLTREKRASVIAIMDRAQQLKDALPPPPATPQPALPAPPLAPTQPVPEDKLRFLRMLKDIEDRVGPGLPLEDYVSMTEDLERLFDAPFPDQDPTLQKRMIYILDALGDYSQGSTSPFSPLLPSPTPTPVPTPAPQPSPSPSPIQTDTRDLIEEIRTGRSALINPDLTYAGYKRIGRRIDELRGSLVLETTPAVGEEFERLEGQYRSHPFAQAPPEASPPPSGGGGSLGGFGGGLVESPGLEGRLFRGAQSIEAAEVAEKLVRLSSEALAYSEDDPFVNIMAQVGVDWYDQDHKDFNPRRQLVANVGAQVKTFLSEFQAITANLTPQELARVKEQIDAVTSDLTTLFTTWDVADREIKLEEMVKNHDLLMSTTGSRSFGFDWSGADMPIENLEIIHRYLLEQQNWSKEQLEQIIGIMQDTTEDEKIVSKTRKLQADQFRNMLRPKGARSRQHDAELIQEIAKIAFDYAKEQDIEFELPTDATQHISDLFDFLNP